jgi:hypothetical protein
MSLESLANRLGESVYGLYVRQWAVWELELIALAAMVLLLLIMRRRRRTGGAADHHQGRELEISRLASLSKRDGKKKRWGQTARELRSFGALVEDLQIEVSRYRAAEENFKQQLANLKAANERLQRELAARGVQHADLTNAVPLARFGRPQDRMPVQ